ncbi:glycosyltransferase family 2 protein [Rubrobacter indicoceani]|uniref:glycosyltransferase family 2 protein n=1 Tax=Rubrobacter indicoceani TaxID=2051957 RepID=UPI0013C50137|nr:glycosyltransferase family 2 protein [Rubrobacter indicoceani]
MKYSFVLVNYAGSWDLISACLASVVRAARHSGADYEAIVVNNDPPGDEATPNGASVIEAGRNVGFARAVNLGVRATRGDVIVLVNPDSVVGEDFFTSVSDLLAQSPQVGVVGPRILDTDGAVQLSARRELSLVSGLFGRTSLLTRLLPESRFVKRHFPVAAEEGAPLRVDWVSGACLLVRREVLERVGLLDERFFMYFEDADLCRRARAAGYEVRYLPQTAVVHDAGGSTGSRPLAILRLHRSAFLYHRKHGPHGPFGLVSGLVLAGLAVRAAAGILACGLRRGGKP